MNFLNCKEYSRFNSKLDSFASVDVNKEGLSSVENLVSFLESGVTYFNSLNRGTIFDLLNRLHDSGRFKALENRIQRIIRWALPLEESTEDLSSYFPVLGPRDSCKSFFPVPKKNKVYLPISRSEQLLLNEVIAIFESCSSSRARKLAGVLKKALFEENRSWRYCEVDGGYTVFHFLVLLDEECVRKILASAYDLDLFAGKSKLTPLLAAVRKPPIVELLLHKGARPDYENRSGENLIYLAAKSGDSKLLAACLAGGVSVDLISKSKMTALTKACFEDELEVVKKLIEFGADPNLLDGRGEYPLTYAIRDEHIEIIRYLIEQGANVNLFDKDHYTFLMTAIAHGRVASVKALLAAGADLNLFHSAGMPFLEHLFATKKLSFENIEKMKQYLCTKGLNEKMQHNILSRKLLAHIWGIGNELTFRVDGKEITYDGLNENVCVRKMVETFFEYVPRLQERYSRYLTDSVSERIRSSVTAMLLNRDFVARKDRNIRTDSEKVLQVLMSGWNGHTTSAGILGDLFFTGNRGDLRDPDFAIGIYRMHAPISSALIRRIRKGNDKDLFLSETAKLLQLELIEKIRLPDQGCGNCSWTSSKMALFVILLFAMKEHSDDRIAGNALQIAARIYRSYTSFVRENELERYLQVVNEGAEEIDWLLLSRIRNKIEKKLEHDALRDYQKEIFHRALNHFDTYLTPEMLRVTEENREEIIHYLFASNDSERMNEAFVKGLKINASFGGVTLLDTVIDRGSHSGVKFLRKRGALTYAEIEEKL